MSNDANQKDFFIWWREDLTPASVAARKNLEPHIKRWQEIAVAFNKALNQFVEEHRETIELWAAFAKAYPQLEPYIDNITQGLNDPDFEIANDVVEIAHIFEVINLERSSESVSILSVISSPLFQKSIIDFYTNLPLEQERLQLIQEALLLHNLSYYGGSICLLYGLIEGTLTESFEKANYVSINANKINPIEVDGTTNTGRNLTGLVQKLEHAISKRDELSTYYGKIKSYQLVNGDPQETIPKTRNNILHGGSVDFNTEKRSAQLIL